MPTYVLILTLLLPRSCSSSQNSTFCEVGSISSSKSQKGIRYGTSIESALYFDDLLAALKRLRKLFVDLLIIAVYDLKPATPDAMKITVYEGCNR